MAIARVPFGLFILAGAGCAAEAEPLADFGALAGAYIGGEAVGATIQHASFQILDPNGTYTLGFANAGFRSEPRGLGLCRGAWAVGPGRLRITCTSPTSDAVSPHAALTIDATAALDPWGQLSMLALFPSPDRGHTWAGHFEASWVPNGRDEAETQTVRRRVELTADRALDRPGAVGIRIRWTLEPGRTLELERAATLARLDHGGLRIWLVDQGERHPADAWRQLLRSSFGDEDGLRAREMMPAVLDVAGEGPLTGGSVLGPVVRFPMGWRSFAGPCPPSDFDPYVPADVATHAFDAFCAAR